MKLLRRTLVTITMLTLVVCGIYPAIVTGMAKVLFPAKQSGSLVFQGERLIGSRLIGQGFSRPAYFHPRPSAAGDRGFDAASSGAANLSLTNPKLLERIKADITRLRAENHGQGKMPIPVELVTTSASGLDPDLSPEGALFQVPRVAAARGLNADLLRQLVAKQTQPRPWGLLGEETVNVLELNLAVDALGSPQ